MPRAWCLAAVAGLIACTLAGCSDPPPATTPETPEAGQQLPAAPPAANVLPPEAPPQRQPQQRPIPPAGSPNLLLISIDTLRADHLGCYGHPDQATPNLDALAEAGLRFTRCIASSPITLPSHATMLTGSYPFVHGARSNVRFRVSSENQTVTELLRARGYRTWAEVAATVLNREAGLSQGFDLYRGPGGMPGAALERRADDITDAALAYLAKPAKRPFFGFVHYFDPHAPYAPPAPFDTRFDDPYVGEIAYTDQQVGRLLQGLAESPYADNTIVIVTADHGEGRGQHGEASHSFYLYDTTQHVPLILWRPGTITPGVSERQVRLVDLAPTIAGLLGLPTTEQMQGADLLQGSDVDRVAYAETLEPQLAFEFSKLRALWSDGWKYIHAPQPLLFDLKRDPGEETNLAKAEPDRLAAMQAHLRTVIEAAPDRIDPSVARRRVDQQDLEDLAALGYVGGQDDEVEPSELDAFAAEGRDPHVEQATLQRFTLAVGQLMSKDYAAAVPTLEDLLSREPDSSMLLRYYAEALEGAGRPEDALQAYERLLAARPQTTTARLQMARLQRQQGDAAGAKDTLRTLIELAPQQTAAYIDLHAVLGELGDFEAAEEVLQQGRRAVPDDYQLNLVWARQLFAKRQGSEGVKMLQTLMQSQPARFDAYGTLADFLAQTGDEAASLKTLMDYHKRYPGVRRAIDPLARALVRGGKPVEAIAVWESNWDELPPSGLRSLQLGVALRRAGRAEDALKRFAEATTLDPKLPAAWLGLAQLSEKTGANQQAFDAYQQLLTTAPRNPEGYLGSASLLLFAGHVQAAADTLEAGVRTIPRSPRLLESLTWLRATSADASVRDCGRAAELAGKLEALAAATLSVLDTRAAALACGGDFAGAIALLEQAPMEGAPQQLVEQIQARLQLYRSEQPFLEK